MSLSGNHSRELSGVTEAISYCHTHTVICRSCHQASAILKPSARHIPGVVGVHKPFASHLRAADPHRAWWRQTGLVATALLRWSLGRCGAAPHQIAYWVTRGNPHKQKPQVKPVAKTRSKTISKTRLSDVVGGYNTYNTQQHPEPKPCNQTHYCFLQPCGPHSATDLGWTCGHPGSAPPPTPEQGPPRHIGSAAYAAGNEPTARHAAAAAAARGRVPLPPRRPHHTHRSAMELLGIHQSPRGRHLRCWHFGTLTCAASRLF